MSPHDQEILIKLCVSVLVGAVIGAEREYRDKPAGFRTIILITLGSTLFTILSLSIETSAKDRIAANIVTGIGFLGAGAIMRENGRFSGLTTAATIWLSAAIGMAVGAGELSMVAMAVGITLLVLVLFSYLEVLIDGHRETRRYKIVLLPIDLTHLVIIHQALQTCGLRILERHRTKTSEVIESYWIIRGHPKSQERFVELMMQDACIRELSY